MASQAFEARRGPRVYRLPQLDACGDRSPPSQHDHGARVGSGGRPRKAGALRVGAAPGARGGLKFRPLAADVRRVRGSAVAVVALALAAAGCAHEVPALKAKAREVTPAGSRSAGDCASSEALIESAWV